jgi:secernin
VCCELLEAHGQGGRCEEILSSSWSYENGFMFADATEAFVLETAGVRNWCLERVKPGTLRNISNGLSIRTNIEACSAGIQELCKTNGWWDGQAAFDWKAAVGFGGKSSHANLDVGERELAGKRMLESLKAACAAGELSPDDASAWCGHAAAILRDEDSGICFRGLHSFCSTGSQVSWLPSSSGVSAPSHLFTASSDPLCAAYKRFSFGDADVPADPPATNPSLELWRAWRRVALAGGLHVAAKSTKVADELKSMMASNEAAALGAVAQGASDGPTAFDSSVKAELDALNQCLSKK